MDYIDNNIDFSVVSFSFCSFGWSMNEFSILVSTVINE